MKCDKILAGTKSWNTMYINIAVLYFLSEREVVPQIS